MRKIIIFLAISNLAISSFGQDNIKKLDFNYYNKNTLRVEDDFNVKKLKSEVVKNLIDSLKIESGLILIQKKRSTLAEYYISNFKCSHVILYENDQIIYEEKNIGNNIKEKVRYHGNGTIDRRKVYRENFLVVDESFFKINLLRSRVNYENGIIVDILINNEKGQTIVDSDLYEGDGVIVYKKNQIKTIRFYFEKGTLKKYQVYLDNVMTSETVGEFQNEISLKERDSLYFIKNFPYSNKGTQTTIMK